MRAGNLVEALAAGWQVHLAVINVAGARAQKLSPAIAAHVEEWTELSGPELLDPAYARFLRIPPGPERPAGALAFGRPLDVPYRPELVAERVFHAFPGVNFDAVFVMRSYMAAAAAQFLTATPRPMIVLDADDDDVEAHRRFGALYTARNDAFGAALESVAARLYAAWEQEWLPQFDLVFAASETDALRMAGRVPDALFDVIPNVVRAPERRSANTVAQRDIPMLMVGNMSYLPNAEGADFFVRQVLPHIRDRAVDSAAVVIAGSDPAPDVTALAEVDGVTVAANPPDIEPLYSRARLVVVPIRAGGGTRLKIIEAFAMGVPVVSTRLGAEGLAVEHGTHLLLADEPTEIADACVRLLHDDALCTRLADAAQALQRDQYSLDALRTRMSAAATA